jgi:hypothetical protein
MRRKSGVSDDDMVEAKPVAAPPSAWVHRNYLAK